MAHRYERPLSGCVRWVGLVPHYWLILEGFPHRGDAQAVQALLVWRSRERAGSPARERAAETGHQVWAGGLVHAERRAAPYTCLNILCRVSVAPPPSGCAVYCGFDPTAPDLHLGHLLAINTLLHFRHAGYQPIAVVHDL